MSRQRLIGIFGVFTLILGAATVQAPMALAASVWWVDNTSPLCSNTAPGTSDTRLCTISAAAASTINAGDQVMVRPGTYAEQVTVAASGAVGNPITFIASAPGVVVRGTRDLSDAAGWTAFGATAWSRAYAPPSAPRQVFRDNVRLAAAASLAALTAGQFFHDTVAKVLYVDAGGSNPADGHTLAAGAQTYGFNLVGRSNVVVNGFTLKRQNNAGVRLSGSSVVTVQNVTATEAGINGILLESATSNVTVTGSTVSGSASAGIKLSATTGFRITANTSRTNNFHGISLATSSNNVIEVNESSENRVPTGTNAAAGIDVNTTSPDTCGNGTPAVLTPTATCIYPTSGTFTAGATVTDDHGATSTVGKSVTVKADEAPTVMLAPIKSRAKVNEKLLVDASNPTDPDKTPIASYRLDCGNGVVSGSGLASSATCQYARSGTYTIRVTVTDTIGRTGRTGSASDVVRVR